MEGIRSLNRNGSIQIHLHKTFYEPEAIKNAAFGFSKYCYIFISPYDMEESLVRFELKEGVDADLEFIVKEFCNAVLDHQIRLDLEKMNSKIKNLIVKQAFMPVEKLVVGDLHES